MTFLWFVVWLIANHIGGSGSLIPAPVNAWMATFILAIALDLAGNHAACGQGSTATDSLAAHPRQTGPPRHLARRARGRGRPCLRHGNATDGERAARHHADQTGARDVIVHDRY